MISYSNLPDIQLIELLREGDRSAFTEIHNRYFNLVFIEAYKKLREKEQAKDVVQDLFISLWYRRENIPAVQNLAGYLLKAIRYSIFGVLDHQKVESKYISSLADYVNTGSIAHTDYLVREKEWNQYIETAIQTLPATMKHVFELNKKENLSYKEIAKKLNTSENNIQKHINGAIKILKKKLTVFF